jgi:broad specificity phosphatase PhoE
MSQEPDAIKKPSELVLYLARHGETDFNLRKIFQGRSDIPLNDRGLEQAHTLRELLATVPISRAYMSPLERARVTAAIILEDRDIPQMVESRLVEINFGEWEGTPEAEVREKWMEDYMDYRNDLSRFRPLKGESALEARKRAGEWWDELVGEIGESSGSDEHILVVAHQSLNAVLGCYVAGIPLSEGWSVFKTRPGEVIKIIPGAFARISRLIPDIEEG